MDAKLIDRLVELGLSEYEGKCYVALLTEHPARPYPLSKKTGIPTSKIYEVVGRLEARGLVFKLTGDNEGYVPKDPEKALSEWRGEYLERLEDVGTRLKSVMGGRPTYMIWNTVQNGEVVSQGRRLLSAAERTVFLIATPRLLEPWCDDLTKAGARGVAMHLISYGKPEFEFGKLDIRVLESPIRERPQGTVLAVDRVSVLFVSADASGGRLQASWTDNPAIALMAEEYVEDKLLIERLVENHWIQWVDTE